MTGAREVITGSLRVNADVQQPLRVADDILDDLNAAGLAVGPLEPTKAMTPTDVILKVLHTYNCRDNYIDWERSDADAILSALAAAGLVVVPREPTG